MHERHVSGLPVVDNDSHIYGMITEADIMRYLYPFPVGEGAPKRASSGERQNRGIVRWFLESADYESSSEAYQKVKTTAVSEVMTKDVHAASPGDGLGHVVRLMQEKGVNRIPIVEKGRLVGIVARSDVVRMAAGGPQKKPAPAPAAGYR
jgi:CBS domain-containing protein